MEKPDEDKEKLELFTDELALAIAAITRWLIANNKETFQEGQLNNDENK